MKTVITYHHPDGVSGITIMDDGTKAYWTEGRSSTITVVHPNSDQEVIGPWGNHPVWDALNANNAYKVTRPMTNAEVAEYAAMRGV